MTSPPWSSTSRQTRAHHSPDSVSAPINVAERRLRLGFVHKLPNFDSGRSDSKRDAGPDSRLSECDPMLLTFLFDGHSKPGPTAPNFGVAYTLFNGKLRLRALSLREAGAPPALVPAAPGDRILIFRAIVSSGSPDRVTGNFSAALADDDGNTVMGRPLEGDWNLARGGAARTGAEFHVDPDFIPLKLILIDTSDPDVPRSGSTCARRNGDFFLSAFGLVRQSCRSSPGARGWGATPSPVMPRAKRQSTK